MPSNNIYWQSAIIVKILKRMDYLGHTVCGMSYKKSYRDKRTCRKPKDEWIITENTHEQIVDIDIWERVQKLRENTRRGALTIGDMGALNGILFCADCNKRLRIHRSRKKNQKESYICPTYSNSKRFGKGQCTMHSTPRPFIEALILSEIQRVTEFARDREDEFVALVEKAHERTSNSELHANKMELEKTHRRISELDLIIQRLYEDNVAGRLSNERFDKMYAGFETEQMALKTRASELSVVLDSEKEKSVSITRFLGLVKKYTDISELTAENVRVFIDRIVVHQATDGRWNRKQQIDIYYNFIGLLE